MKNFKTNLYIIAFLLLTLNTYSLSAHFGPRGLLGGTPHVGIQYNGNVYLGTEDAGVFESTNTTLTTWRPRPVGLKSGHITALAHTGTELFAATDNGVFIFNGFEGSDRYWNLRNSGLGSLEVISLLAIDANTLFAGTDGGGLYKTTDKGVNWTLVSSASFNGKSITALTKGGSRLFALVRDGGVFASDNNGTTWFSLNDANTLNKTASECFTYNASTNELLVSNVSGMFVLTSANTTTTPAYATAVSGLPGSIHIHALTNNGNSWFLASHSGVYKSATSSVSWSAVNTGLPNNDVETIIAIDDTLVVGMTKYGVYKSNANTVNWVANNAGLMNINTTSVASKGDSLVIAATEYGVTVSTNIGNNPVISNNGLTDSLNVNDVEIGGDLFFAATTNMGVFVSNNKGQSWTAQNTGLTNMNIDRIVYGSGRIYALSADGKIYQSNVPSISWTLTTTGLPASPKATSLTFFANNIVLGTNGNGVYIKHRDSATWNPFNTGLTNLSVTSVTYSAGKLFAGTDGSGVFVSNASSAGWSAAAPISISHFNNVPFLQPSHIEYMTTVREHVVATFKGGVVSTTDGGATWFGAGNQFNLPSYSSFRKASYVTTRLFVNSESNSIYAQGMAELDYEDSLLVVNEAVVNAPMAGMQSYHSITSNMKWKITSSASWVTASADSGMWNDNLMLNIAANTTGAARTATVTVKGDTLTRTITVSQQGSTSIKTNNAATMIKVFPNPNNGTFTIDLSAIDNVLEVAISDVAGRLVRAIPVSKRDKLVISENLLPGTYYVNIKTNNSTTTKKIVVQ